MSNRVAPNPAAAAGLGGAQDGSRSIGDSGGGGGGGGTRLQAALSSDSGAAAGDHRIDNEASGDGSSPGDGGVSDAGDSDVAPVDTSRNRRLLAAAREGHVEVVQELLKAGAYVNAKDQDWPCATALMLASGNKHPGVVRILLAAHADVNAKDEDGRTALMYAVRHTEAVRRMLADGTDILLVNTDRWADLITDYCRQNLVLVRLLLPEYAVVDAADKNGWTALMFAVAESVSETEVEVVQELVEANADVNATDKNGISVLLRALAKGRLDVVELLLEWSARSTDLTTIPTSSADAAARTPQRRRLYDMLYTSATKGDLRRICIEATKSQISDATSTADNSAATSSSSSPQRILLARPEVVCFLCRLMLATGQELLCSPLVSELLPRSMAQEWPKARRMLLVEPPEGGGSPFVRLVQELGQHNTRLLAQLLLGARVALLTRGSSASSGRGLAARLTLQVPTATAPPLISQRDSGTGRSFLPLAFHIPEVAIPDAADPEDIAEEQAVDALYEHPEQVEALGRSVLESAPAEVVEAARACVAALLQWRLPWLRRRLAGQSSGRGWALGYGMLRCWEVVAEVAAARGHRMTAHWYASASLALVHVGPTGLLAAATMASTWLVALVVLQPLLLVALHPFNYVLTTAALVAHLAQAAVKAGAVKTPISIASGGDGASDDDNPWGGGSESERDGGSDGGWRQQYTVSVSEVQLPGASTLLNTRILAGVLSDPRVDPRLWTCPAYQIIMELRWLRFNRHVVTGMFFIRLAHLATFITYILNFPVDSDAVCDVSALQQGCMVVLATMTAELAVVEVRQVVALGSVEWLSQPWNLFDGAQIGLMTTTLALHWSCTAPLHVVRCLAAVLVLVLFWRLSGYAIAVPGLGGFVRMVLEVSMDLRWFFVFLGASMLGFGLALQVLGLDISGVGTEEVGPSGGPVLMGRLFARLYSMIFGDFDAALLLEPHGGGGSSGGGGAGTPRSLATLTAVICCLYMLFVAVVLFNLLIAVIGDAYDRVAQQSDTHLARSKAALVVESELLLPKWFVKKRDAALLQCDLLLVLQNELVASEEEDEPGGGIGGGGGGAQSFVQSYRWRGRLGETQNLLATTENLPLKTLLREVQAGLARQVLQQAEQQTRAMAEMKAGLARKINNQADAMQQLQALTQAQAAQLARMEDALAGVAAALGKLLPTMGAAGSGAGVAGSVVLSEAAPAADAGLSGAASECLL